MPRISIGEQLVIEYEEIMLGNRKMYSASLLREPVSNKDAGTLFRYVFVYILGWGVADCQNRITKRLIAKLGLSSAMRFVAFPPGLDPQRDLFYLAAVIFPDKVSYTRKDYALKTYKDVLEGRAIRFPRGFFEESEGYDALLICLRYAIEEYLPPGMRDTFIYFADTHRANEFLTRMRLANYVRKYHPRAIDAVYEAYKGIEEAEFWYRYAAFVIEWNRLCPERRIKL